MENSSFWIIGAMPVQLLLVLAGVFFIFQAGQFLLKKIGRPVPAFGQAVLILAASYGILKWVIHPPLPLSLIINYMAVIVLATFLLVSSTNRSWNSFKTTLLNTLMGRTFGHRIARAMTVLLIPLGVGLFVFQFVKPPEIVAPRSFAGYHPAPPHEITVYPPEYFSQK